MKKLIAKAALLLATTLALPMSAHAVEWTWAWTPIDEGSTATFGTLTTDAFDSTVVGTYVGQQLGGYLITAMTGTWNAQAITLLAPGTFPSEASNDNYLFEGFYPLDFFGVSFSTVAGNVNLRVYDAQYYYVASYFPSGGAAQTGTFTATISPIPEPETYALMLAGLAVVGAAAKRQRKTT